MPSPCDVRASFGDIDIYLFDQLQRGRIAPGARIFDAGCGAGRNVAYFLREGYDVRGVDADAGAIASLRALAARLAPSLGDDRFLCESIEASSTPSASADVVIASAVLHFARDREHFEAMVHGAWRVLAPRGLWFSRLASTIGMEDRVQPLGGGRYRLPDGSDRYLVDEAQLVALSAALGSDLIDPIKTTVVQNQRAMTTWVLRKR